MLHCWIKYQIPLCAVLYQWSCTTFLRPFGAGSSTRCLVSYLLCTASCWVLLPASPLLWPTSSCRQKIIGGGGGPYLALGKFFLLFALSVYRFNTLHVFLRILKPCACIWCRTIWNNQYLNMLNYHYFNMKLPVSQNVKSPQFENVKLLTAKMWNCQYLKIWNCRTRQQKNEKCSFD